VIEEAGRRGALALPGAFTATEVLRATAAGAPAVKVFPAGPVGAGYVKALRGPLPDVPLVPTGGIELEDVAPFLTAGAVAVGLGGCLVRSGDPSDGLAERAVLIRAAVEAA
jgi:2-dehydro-3-deoxyphosphogluconate aldolase / (4S)-4-hydroxy-2-oxoglutarate aldolase